MVKFISYPMIKSLDFAIWQNKYVTLKELTFENIKVPKGFVFDGVTVKAPFTILFSNKNLRNGIRASCYHDYLCENRHMISRKEASKLLKNMWVTDGLPTWKGWIAYFSVEIYQYFKGWK